MDGAKCSWGVPFGKQPAPQLANNFPAFYVTEKFRILLKSTHLRYL
jgi:hypothetical protein